MGERSGAVSYPDYISFTHSQLLAGLSNEEPPTGDFPALGDYWDSPSDASLATSGADHYTNAGMVGVLGNALHADNPYTGITLQPPYPYLDLVDDRMEDYAVVADSLDPNLMTLRAINSMQEVIRHIPDTNYDEEIEDLDSLLDLITTLESDVANWQSGIEDFETELDSLSTYLDSFATAPDTSDLVSEVSSFSTTKLPELARAYNRMAAGLMDINATEGSVMPSGFAILELNHQNQVMLYQAQRLRELNADYREDRRAVLAAKVNLVPFYDRLYTIRNDASRSALAFRGELLNLRMAVAAASSDVRTKELEHGKVKAMSILQGIQNYTQNLQLQLQSLANAVQLQGDVAKSRIVATGDFENRAMEYDVLEIKWEMTLMNEATRMIGATSGIPGMNEGVPHWIMGMQAVGTVGQMVFGGLGAAAGVMSPLLGMLL